jgi:hypothetical protein
LVYAGKNSPPCIELCLLFRIAVATAGVMPGNVV